MSEVSSVYGLYDNNAIFYVGVTSKSLSWRKTRHIRHSFADNRDNPVHGRIRSLGRDGFSIHLLETVPSDIALAVENEWIAASIANGHEMCNIAGNPHSNTALHGRKKSDSHRAAIAAARTGTTQSAYTREKISASKLGVPFKTDQTAAECPICGKSFLGRHGLGIHKARSHKTEA